MELICICCYSNDFVL